MKMRFSNLFKRERQTRSIKVSDECCSKLLAYTFVEWPRPGTRVCWWRRARECCPCRCRRPAFARGIRSWRVAHSPTRCRCAPSTASPPRRWIWCWACGRAPTRTGSWRASRSRRATWRAGRTSWPRRMWSCWPRWRPPWPSTTCPCRVDRRGGCRATASACPWTAAETWWARWRPPSATPWRSPGPPRRSTARSASPSRSHLYIIQWRPRHKTKLTSRVRYQSESKWGSKICSRLDSTFPVGNNIYMQSSLENMER